MKHFLYRISIFLLFVFLGAIAIEYILLFKENEYSYKYSYLQNHSDDIECLILGASVSSNGINPSLFSNKCFNAAIEGRPLYYDYAITKELVPKMTKLKTIILTITPSQLYRNYKYVVESSLSDNDSDPAYRNMHLKYMGLRYDWKDVFYYMEIFNSYYDYMGRFYNSDESNRLCDTLGYQILSAQHLNDNWRSAKVINAIDYTDKNVELAVKENVSYLKGIADICSKNGIRFLLIWPPFHKIGRNQVTKSDLIFFDQSIKALKKDCKEIEFYDFSKDERLQSDDFYYNPTHLNSLGANLFSEILDSIVARKQ